ncbi:MAG: NAD(P)/FAD-dependent oxidoreductase [Gammaproteobacteria bacterium]|nr:MAG: NAD(P)/FAD-dependent oxidoreductase [Gammaproteobacteria bacterium]
MPDAEHYQVLIVGGGTGGIAVASHLRKEAPELSVAVVEPSDTHYYQPGWTLVGAGLMRPERTARPMEKVIPEGVQWIRERVTRLEPDQNRVVTDAGRELGYDFLVVAAGLRIAWEAVPGLREGLEQGSVLSIYDYRHAQRTRDALRAFQGGTAVFTQPKPPFKCPGAAQKIMYLADEIFRRRRVRDRSRILFHSAAPGIFPVKKYATVLNQVIQRKGLETHYQSHLVELRPDRREAVMEGLADGRRETVSYDLIHVTPPQGPPAFIKDSPLADPAGWLEVDMHTLRHPRYENVFGLGDCTNTPNSKTAAAIRAQTPVLVSNLLTALNGQPGKAAYDGYASCPLVTGFGRLVLAEFDYNLIPKETFPFDQGRERRSMFWLKRYALPVFYWNVLLKGGDLNLGA